MFGQVCNHNHAAVLPGPPGRALTRRGYACAVGASLESKMATVGEAGRENGKGEAQDEDLW